MGIAGARPRVWRKCSSDGGATSLWDAPSAIGERATSASARVSARAKGSRSGPAGSTRPLPTSHSALPPVGADPCGRSARQEHALIAHALCGVHGQVDAERATLSAAVPTCEEAYAHRRPTSADPLLDTENDRSLTCPTCHRRTHTEYRNGCAPRRRVDGLSHARRHCKGTTQRQKGAAEPAAPVPPVRSRSQGHLTRGVKEPRETPPCPPPREGPLRRVRTGNRARERESDKGGVGARLLRRERNSSRTPTLFSFLFSFWPQL
eukprot:scaffold21262_cov30-Tisochrysis_lutea.AAC.4